MEIPFAGTVYDRLADFEPGPRARPAVPDYMIGASFGSIMGSVVARTLPVPSPTCAGGRWPLR